MVPRPLQKLGGDSLCCVHMGGRAWCNHCLSGMPNIR